MWILIKKVFVLRMGIFSCLKREWRTGFQMQASWSEKSLSSGRLKIMWFYFWILPYNRFWFCWNRRRPFSWPKPSSESNSESIDSNFWETSENTLKWSLRKKFPRYLMRFAKFWKAEPLNADSKRLLKKKSLLIKRRKKKISQGILLGFFWKLFTAERNG